MMVNIMNRAIALSETLRTHVESHYPLLYLVTFEENKADSLIREFGVGRKILEWNMAGGIVDFASKHPLSSYCDLSSALETFSSMELDNHFLVIKDAHLALLDNPLSVARLKALANKLIHDDTTLATVFLVSNQVLVPPELEKFITLFELPLPNEQEIRAIIVDHAGLYDITVSDHDLSALTLAFRGLSEHEIRHLLNRGYQQDGNIDKDDLALVYSEKEQIVKKSGILDMIPRHESIDSIGGLEQLKAWLRQKAKVLADLPGAQAFGVDAPKGVMIVGMPGCGKSLAAKAAATLFELPLLRLDIGSLLGKYVGESEGNMRRALKLAEAVSPCVLWIDELEKAFVGIAGGNNGSEVAIRLFGHFLTWMQEKSGAVFVLATANDISALPPELLRKGRFDEIFYVDFPVPDERKAIFRIHLEKRNQRLTDIDYAQLAAKTDGFTGADIEAVVKETIEQAFVGDKAALTTERILCVIEATDPLKIVMKDKVQEYEAKFKNLHIKKAS